MHLDFQTSLKFLILLKDFTGCFKLWPKYQHLGFPRTIGRWECLIQKEAIMSNSLAINCLEIKQNLAYKK